MKQIYWFDKLISHTDILIEIVRRKDLPVICEIVINYPTRRELHQ